MGYQFIWCQKFEHYLKEGHFHLGIALFRSWQTTMQACMVAWKKFHRFKRSVKNQEKLVAKFQKTLSQIYFKYYM